MLFHPPAAHEEHSAGDSIKSEDEQEQDSQIVEIDAGIAAEMAAEMAVASNGNPVAEESEPSKPQLTNTNSAPAAESLEDGASSVGGNEEGKKKRKKRNNKKKKTKNAADSISEVSMNDQSLSDLS